MTNYSTFQIHVVSDSDSACLTLQKDERVCVDYTWLYTWTITKIYPISYSFALHGTRQETSHMERALHPQYTVFAPALIIISAD